MFAPVLIAILSLPLNVFRELQEIAFQHVIMITKEKQFLNTNM